MRHQRQDQHGDPVQPLDVVDHTEQRLLGGRLGNQSEDGRTQLQQLGRRAGAEAQGGAQGLPVLGRDPVEKRQQGDTELFQTGVRDLGLRLVARGQDDPEAVRLAGDVLDQGALAAARLAAQHECPAPAVTYVEQETTQRLLLLLPPQQYRHGVFLPRAGSLPKDLACALNRITTDPIPQAARPLLVETGRPIARFEPALTARRGRDGDRRTEAPWEAPPFGGSDERAVTVRCCCRR